MTIKYVLRFSLFSDSFTTYAALVLYANCPMCGETWDCGDIVVSILEVSLGYLYDWKSVAGPSMLLALVTAQITHRSNSFVSRSAIDRFLNLAASLLGLCSHLGVFLCGYFCIHYLMGRSATAELNSNDT